jgi:serine/threonine protein phosphatase PrpC
VTLSALRCSACDEPLVAGDRFCEACGRDASGAGRRTALDLAVAAAVSEQGRSHTRNEDAFELKLVGADGVVAVVCDGVSTAAAGVAAARAAAESAAEALTRALGAGEDAGRATADAVVAARDAVGRVPATTRSALALPSCTFVSAACRAGRVVVGWVGDSRAYWLSADDADQLTVDHSWAVEQVAAGMPAQAALTDRRAHAITRWIGADAPDAAPEVRTFQPSSPGRLVLCTDGLWNSAPAAQDLAALLKRLGAGATASAVAHHLADTALARGARDDVTVAVIDVHPREVDQP